MKVEHGENFDISKINLAEFERRTGITRARLRKLKANGFEVHPHGLSGKASNRSVLKGFTGLLDNLLRSSVTNSSVCYDWLCDNGYTGGKTAVKDYIRTHRELVPPKRQHVSP